MAYRKRQTKSKYSSRSNGGAKRKSYTRTTRKRSVRSRAPTQTLRIVVEQPNAVSSVEGHPVGATTKQPRKAMF